MPTRLPTLRPDAPTSPWGRHAASASGWFDPRLAWGAALVLTWLLALWHQTTCFQPSVTDRRNTLMRLCYSDLPLAWTSHLAGLAPYAHGEAQPSPLVALLQIPLRLLVRPYAQIGPGLPPEQLRLGANAFMVISAVVLLFALLALGGAVLSLLQRTALVGELSPTARAHCLAALALTALTVSMINFDLLAAALLMAGLATWIRGSQLAPGLLLGLAAVTSGLALWGLVGVVLVLVFGSRWNELLRVAGSALATMVVVSLLAVISGRTNPATWLGQQLDPDVGLGSLWYLLELGRFTAAGPIATGLTLIGVVAVAALLAQWPGLQLRATANPDLQGFVVLRVVALLVAIAQSVTTNHTPQQALLLVGLVIVIRPGLGALIWAVINACYFAAVFGYLDGYFSQGSTWIYKLATVLMLASGWWLAGCSVADLAWVGRRRGSRAATTIGPTA